MSMNNMNFVKGIGIGMIVGSAIGMAVAPKKSCKSRFGSLMKTFGEVIEGLGESLGL